MRARKNRLASARRSIIQRALFEDRQLHAHPPYFVKYSTGRPSTAASFLTRFRVRRESCLQGSLFEGWFTALTAL